MKRMNFLPLYKYSFKILSLILASVSIIFMCINFYADYFKTLFLLSMVGMMFSEEKYENDMIKNIRFQVLRLSFIVLFTLFFAQFVLTSIDKNHILSNNLIFLALSFTSITYLILFYSIIFFKKNFEFESNKISIKNVKSIFSFYLLYSIFILIIFVLFELLLK